MSDIFVSDTPAVSQGFSIVRIVANSTPIPLQKLDVDYLEEPEVRVLLESLPAESTIVDPFENDEVGQLLDSVIDDEGEYIPEPELEVQFYDEDEPTPEPEEPFDLESMFAPEVTGNYVAKANEENMKDTPLVVAAYGRQEDAIAERERLKRDGTPNALVGEGVGEKVQRLPFNDATKPATEKGPIQFLKSVEGRVLTVLEATISNDAQREAVKTLIKKEFRREMSRVNRSDDED